MSIQIQLLAEGARRQQTIRVIPASAGSIPTSGRENPAATCMPRRRAWAPDGRAADRIAEHTVSPPGGRESWCPRFVPWPRENGCLVGGTLSKVRGTVSTGGVDLRFDQRGRLLLFPTPTFAIIEVIPGRIARHMTGRSEPRRASCVDAPVSASDIGFVCSKREGKYTLPLSQREFVNALRMSTRGNLTQKFILSRSSQKPRRGAGSSASAAEFGSARRLRLLGYRSRRLATSTTGSRPER